MSSDIVVPSALTFAEGLVGLPDLVSFEVRPLGSGELVELVSGEDASFGVVAASAEDLRPGMTAALVERGAVDGSEVLLVLLAVHGEPAVVTANLAGPIAVGPDGAARQLVLEDPAFPLRVPLGVLRGGSGAAAGSTPDAPDSTAPSRIAGAA